MIDFCLSIYIYLSIYLSIYPSIHPSILKSQDYGDVNAETLQGRLTMS